MGSTRLLTNIIQRKVMFPEEMSPSMQRDNFEVALTDFEKHPIIKCLFKADNQRSTECWSVQEIANFIEDCTEDQNINLCILYWKDIHGNIYIIDGAHRLPVSMRGSIDILRMSKSLKHLISMIHKNKIFVTSAII